MKKWIFAFILVTFISLYFIIGQNDEEINVAILDSGISSEYIKQNITTINFSTEKHSKDNHNHGTAISNLVTQNRTKANFYHLKVLNNNGETTLTNVEKAIDWCNENNIDIVNMSFGFTNYDHKLSKKLDELVKSGTIVIASSGNNLGGKSDFPATKSNIVSVGGLDKDFKISKYSSSGKIDIYNLSENIESINNKGKLELFSGNSFATALTTNEIIKMKQSNKGLNSNTLKSYSNNFKDFKIKTSNGDYK
ncbi:S8 family serine peptidase [Staphylococcus pseudintermedius]|nr:S8 family serine peptidase [Staphylococcus pseudintermedius]